MIAALLVAMALSAAPADPCVACPPVKKEFKGDFKCKPGLQKYKCGTKWRCLPAPPAELAKRAEQVPPPPPVEQVAPPAVQEAPPRAIIAPSPPTPTPEPSQEAPTPSPVKRTPWRVLALAEAGSTFCGPQVRFLGALRLRHEPTGLGLEVEDMVRYGGGGRLMWYPVQAEHLRLHVNAGLHYDKPYAPTQHAVKRDWDWAAGLGAEVPVAKDDKWGAVVDLRWFRPVGTPDEFSATRVTEESCHQMMLMGGLFYRF